MAVFTTTKMMNLLTLVLVMLPALSLSFSNTNPWRELYERVQGSADTPPPLGRYVCCNNPPTIPPHPRRRFPHRGLFLSLAKRDDRDAPFRKAAMEASAAGPVGPWSTGGSLGEAEGGAPVRENLLMDILNMLRSSDSHRPSRYSGSPAGSTPDDFEDSAYLGKRGSQAGSVFTRKRKYGDIGGPNMDWEE